MVIARVLAGVLGAGVVLCACSVRIAGGPHAPTVSGGASTSSRPAAAQPTPSPTYSQVGGNWVTKSDPDALIEFQMPGQPTVTSQTGYANNGEYQVHRIYRVRVDAALLVSVEVDGGVGGATTVADLATIPDTLLGGVRRAGGTGAQVSDRQPSSIDGHEALDFRLTFAPATGARLRAIWLVRAVRDGGAIVVLETLASPLRPDPALETRAVAYQHRLLASLRLP